MSVWRLQFEPDPETALLSKSRNINFRLVRLDTGELLSPMFDLGSPPIPATTAIVDTDSGELFDFDTFQFLDLNDPKHLRRYKAALARHRRKRAKFH